jgi:ubiquinone/menaquinone biosynthesis C-methylase UbiE
MENFNSKIWEQEIYGNGHHLNMYPFDNVVSFLYRNYPKDKKRKDIKILEIGCGSGNNLWFAAREGFDITGIDGSTSAINFAKERFATERLEGNFIVGDFTKLPFNDYTFDIVIDRCSIVCCNIAAGKQAINEVNRVLKSSGLFFFNAYSQASSSFASGVLQLDGSVNDIKEGSLVGVGNLCFYSYKDILEIFTMEWEIKIINHKENREVSCAKQTTHAEWEVIAKKVSNK